MNIILIRHATTQGNEEKRYIGCRTDEGLSPSGIAACSAAEDIRRACEGAVIFSGPMIRCSQTAQLLFPGRRIDVISEFTETDFGAFEGKTYDELKDAEEYRRWIESRGAIAPPGGEAADKLIKRSMKGFERAVALSENADKAVIVCHGGNIMAIMSTFAGGGLYDHQAGSLEGYSIRFERHGKRISGISYERIGSRHAAGSSDR